ncbi:alkanesulfonate monooxygenase [Scytonema sp. HK-05]|uniref:hypothetical protein n=1 Tax=Scytonema sp. HK-05 TaxID=1137095 RepID=UPI000937FDDF|nr:hypothetical protein [Scytonema sp. HK-05]OKH55898.1 hypothetical protein NIES2130_26175 [Scytonema sp. HK-05]BAY49532.1 alkanesulfonate monooxygenase [Scytonema sp. HK-05]
MVEAFWYLPTQGDERYLGTKIGRREANYPYMCQIAQAVDQLGYGGMLIGTGQRNRVCPLLQRSKEGR